MATATTAGGNGGRSSGVSPPRRGFAAGHRCHPCEAGTALALALGKGFLVRDSSPPIFTVSPSLLDTYGTTVRLESASMSCPAAVWQRGMPCGHGGGRGTCCNPELQKCVLVCGSSGDTKGWQVRALDSRCICNVHLLPSQEVRENRGPVHRALCAEKCGRSALLRDSRGLMPPDVARPPVASVWTRTTCYIRTREFVT